MAAAMADLHAACFTMPPPWSRPAFASLLADPLVLAFAEPQALLVGRVVAGEAELLTLAVHPEARRHGIARRLLQQFHAEALARSATEAFLEVAATNRAAVALYAGAGYAEAGRRRGYYAMAGGAAIDALVLRKPLSSV